MEIPGQGQIMAAKAGKPGTGNRRRKNPKTFLMKWSVRERL
jgi:hypothetical protein